MEIELQPTYKLVPYQGNARTHSKKQIAQIARSINDFGFVNPILVDKNLGVIAGHGRLMAAKELKLTSVPTIRVDHLTEAQKRAYILADNQIAQKSGWDKEIIKIEFERLLTLDVEFDLTMSGFETPEIDLLLNAPVVQDNDALDAYDNDVSPQVKTGEIWQLGDHYLLCGDSLEMTNFARLLRDKKADVVFTDPPYNMKLMGYACGHGSVKHNEFAYASGEMTEEKFNKFLDMIFEALALYSTNGSIHYICMDWRNAGNIIGAAAQHYSEFKNICVWNKQVGAQGSLYRSQHEFVYVFKNGKEPHTNNIELGKYGRCRTNVWDYAGVNRAGGHSEDLKLHPTVKPVQMVADAIVDCSPRGGIVLDCFGGSGSTLLAAEKTRRRAYLIEYEPHYCDVILSRYEKMTGIKPVQVEEAPHA
jgi:DNA modification methylase